MKKGVIVLAHRADGSSVPIAEWYAEGLRARGHADVHVAFHDGDPNIADILKEMNVHGMNNTFIILPLILSEGNLTVWEMPKRMGMPDNSCSYTYLTGTHIAIRFSTAFGSCEAVPKALLQRLEEAGATENDGILLISHGSKMSMCGKDMEHHMRYLSEHGFPLLTACVLENEGQSLEDGIETLIDRGAERIVLLPVFIFGGRSVTETIPEKVCKMNLSIPVVHAECIGRSQYLLDELEGKIPEGW